MKKVIFIIITFMVTKISCDIRQDHEKTTNNSVDEIEVENNIIHNNKGQSTLDSVESMNKIPVQ